MTSMLVTREILEAALPMATLKGKLWGAKAEIGVSIDSRILNPGEVFFAIRGEIDDGHNYIANARLKGASLIVAETSQHAFDHYDIPVITVSDSLKAFSLVASMHLASLNLTKIAITGSNGKTTTKEMIKAALAKVLGEERVYASQGNKNNHFGVPLSALEITKNHKVAIFEMGMNHAGEIANLCQIVSPDIAAITNISFAHGGNFVDGIDGVQHAKGELFQYVAKNNGTIVVNLDDDRVVNEATRTTSKNIVSFGHNEDADVRIISPSPFSLAFGSQQITASVDKKPLLFRLPVLGSHQANNAACALAIVKALGLPVLEASLGLMDMAKSKGRMHIYTLACGAILVNDAYNANPTSMKAGIQACIDLPAKRRIAAIGAMGELGEKSADYHFELGKLLAAHFNHLFICGADSRHTVEGAKNAGLHDNQIVFKNSSTDLIEPLKAFLKEGDLLFVKGSLSANMLLVANAFLE